MVGRRHNATGRSTGRIGSTRIRKANAPPPDMPWIWLTREMLESPAWQALSLNGRRLIERVMLEHMAHGGVENGSLPVTYDDLIAWGIRRNSVAPSIAEAVALGWVTFQRGLPAHKAGQGHSQRFGLTWLPEGSSTVADHRWRRISDLGSAKAVSEAARAEGADGRYQRQPPKI